MAEKSVRILLCAGAVELTGAVTWISCVTFPLFAVKVTHRAGAVFKITILVQVYGHAAANACRQCRPQHVR
ncbi:hypothetical protein CIT292_10998 [Citrobacter youngae ATCC 29220]|uniref:Uncharacterized protein n=1 Tax=Citrobacter youngae ATCC 29220 TaxID=500640 RepID=D4BKC1_9ENTR|nr:hypothetical protein CIT292_10998 [Citrobacter youngae ATCC 29220]